MPKKKGEGRLVVLTDKINTLSPSLSECCIFRVHSQLRDVNRVAYDPVLVSIGPYHRGNERLRMMEEYKLRYLRNAIHRNQLTLETCFSEMNKLEEEARKYYAEPIGLDKDEFTEMLLLDSCFVIEVITTFNIRAAREEDHIIRNAEWMVNCLQRDLMLFENQLPFFVILKMIDLIGHPKIKMPDLNGHPKPHQRFISLALRFFADLINADGTLQSLDPQLPANLDIRGIKHLLGMIHDIWLTSKLGEASYQETQQSISGWQFIPSASKLREAGVTFEKVEEGVLFDISFEKGVIRIPQLRIDDRTECFIRNLIAYEQYKIPSGRVFVTDYVALLDSLIHTPKDVELLCDSKILRNYLGDAEVVSNIFNKINDSVIVPGVHYSHFRKQVDRFCNRKINPHMEKLRKEYLNSPWTIISIVAATTLLLLTVIQTVFAILSY